MRANGTGDKMTNNLKHSLRLSLTALLVRPIRPVRHYVFHGRMARPTRPGVPISTLYGPSWAEKWGGG